MAPARRLRLARATVYLAVGLAVVLLLVHTPLARRPVLNWVAGSLERDSNLRLTTTAFDYNLLTGRVTIRGLTLAAVGHEEAPILTAGELEVRLLWSVFAGQVAIQRLHLSDAVVTIVTDVNGVSNLPPPTDAPVPDPPTRIDVRALTVRNLDFVYLDGETDTDVLLRGIRADLQSAGGQPFGIATGTIGTDRGIAVRFEAQHTASRPVEGRVTFDGSTLAIEAIRLSFPEADATLTGRVTRVLDTAELDLRLEGAAYLPESARWIDPPMPVAGTAALAGTITGALGETVIDGTFVSDDLVLGTADGLGLTGAVRITPDTFVLSNVTLTKGQASADAHVTIPFDEGAPTTVTAAWRQFPLDAVLAIAGLEGAPLGALLDGSLVLDLGTDPATAVSAASFQNRARGFARAGALPVDGRVAAEVSAGRWRATASHRIADALELETSLRGVFAADPAASSVDGPVRLRLTDFERLAAALQRAGIETPPILAESGGRLTAALELGGQLSAPTARGTVTSQDLVLGAAGPALFGVSLSATSDEVRVDDLRLTVAGSVLDAGLRITLPAGTIDGRFRLNAPTLGLALAALPAEARPTGSAEAVGTLRGTLERPLAAVTVNATNVAAGAHRFDSARAELRVSSGAVDLTSLSVAQGEGRLRASGRYAWSTGAYVVDVEARGLTVEEVAGPEAGTRARVDLTFNGRGTVDRPVGQGRATVTLEGGPAGALIGTASADLTLDGKAAHMRAQVPNLGADVRATLEPVTPYAWRADAALTGLDLAPLALLAGAREGAVRGTLTLQSALHGTLTDPASFAATVDVQQLAAEINGVPVALVAPARLRWVADAPGVDDLRVRLGSGELRADGGFGGDDRALAATLVAEAGDLLRMARAFPGIPAEADARGRVALSWAATRGWADPDAVLSVVNGTLGWGELPPVTGLSVAAAFDGTTLDVTRLTGTWQDGGIEATARLPLSLLETDVPVEGSPRGFARARLSGLTHAALTPWMEAEALAGITGRISATLDVEIDTPTPAGVRGTLVFDEAAMTFEGVAIEQQQPSRLSMAGGRIGVDDVRWTAGGSPIALGGSVDLTADDPSLDLTLSGKADLRMVSAFDPTVAAAGMAAVDVRIFGTAGAPEFSGHITLDDVELALSEPPVSLSGVGGIIRLEGNRIVFQDLAGEANGGRLVVTGALTTTGLELTGGAVDLQLDGAALEYPPGLQSEADARLQFIPGPGGPRLSGKVRILRSAYLAPFSFPAMVAASRAAALPPRRGPSYADTIRLDIAVETVADTVVDNNYGRFEAGTDVR
ncbi:MAG: translocation/assembly module TamB domain-containing protein, partial [Vicinamibacterales bacterium]|nr:translocation/assembly module TamB domain-containing protein [Vicinamibacterales bacterium]